MTSVNRHNDKISAEILVLLHWKMSVQHVQTDGLSAGYGYILNKIRHVESEWQESI